MDAVVNEGGSQHDVSHRGAQAATPKSGTQALSSSNTGGVSNAVAGADYSSCCNGDSGDVCTPVCLDGYATVTPAANFTLDCDAVHGSFDGADTALVCEDRQSTCIGPDVNAGPGTCISTLDCTSPGHYLLAAHIRDNQPRTGITCFRARGHYLTCGQRTRSR